jgi:hypothetical protein
LIDVTIIADDVADVKHFLNEVLRSKGAAFVWVAAWSHGPLSGETVLCDPWLKALLADCVSEEVLRRPETPVTAMASGTRYDAQPSEDCRGPG